jgi:SAM-dependent methyltransferase
MSRGRLPAADLRELLRELLPTGASPQVLAEELVPGLLAGRPGARVLDLGCGRGDSVDVFRAADPAVRWVGADLPDSEQLGLRTRADAEIVTFDGTSLPFADASFDVVFCKQVLEHVERPRELLAEVARVLRPGGAFAGSTSHLEPYHGWSVQNLTPYGLTRLLDDAGLAPEVLLAGIDGPTLIVRRLVGRASYFDRYWARRSPLNTLIDGAGRVLGWDAEDRNAMKLLFCGQYAFVAARPAGGHRNV